MWIGASLALLAAAVGQPRANLLVSGRALLAGGEQQGADEVDPIKYLGNYGYLTKDEANRQNSMELATFEQAVREFQRFANITETGKVDARTRQLMSLDRCGNSDLDRAEALSGRNGTLEDPFFAGEPDDESDEPGPAANLTRLERARRHLARHKRYALSDYKWPRLTITYRTDEYSRSGRLKREDWDQTLEQAFGAWSAVVPFRFERRSRGKVDIEVKFVRGPHDGCDQDMSQRSEVLAHAYPPGKTPISGDIHFNDHHGWSADRERAPGARPVLPVAIHEIGHSLGVKHSHIEEAVMYPFNRNHFRLARDDRVAIRKHYAHLARRVDQQQRRPSSRPAGCGAQSHERGPECGQFYDCTGPGRLAQLKYCPPGLFWRQSKLWCDWPHNVPECNNVGPDQDNGLGEGGAKTEGDAKTSGADEGSPAPPSSPPEEAPTEEPQAEGGGGGADTEIAAAAGSDEYGLEPGAGDEATSGGEEGLGGQGEGGQDGESAPGELNTAGKRTKKARRARKKTKETAVAGGQ